MSVKIRMSRHGRRHRPFFRINVIDTHTPRDGRIIEKLGHYDPLEKNTEKEIVLNIERVKYWLDKGAIPSDSVSEILLRKGIKHKYAEEKKTRRALTRKRARAAGLPFLKSERKTKEKPAAGASVAAPAAEKPKEKPAAGASVAAPAAEKLKEKPKEEKKEQPETKA
jgi:small subunit ribosomal protein S16